MSKKCCVGASSQSIPFGEAFRPHVVAALRGIGDFDEQTRKDGKSAPIGATADKKTQWPEGFDPDAAGCVIVDAQEDASDSRAPSASK